MPKIFPVTVVLFDESNTKGYRIIYIPGPTSYHAEDLRAFNAELICQRIQQAPASGGFVPDTIYKVDVPNDAPHLEAMAAKRPKSTETFKGQLNKNFFTNSKVGRIYFAAYAKASPAPTAVKRERSAEVIGAAAKKARTPRTIEAVTTYRSINLCPVAIEIQGYADGPIYIVGDDKGRLELVRRCLSMRRTHK